MLIFLDIDGVLNTEYMWKKLYSIDDDCIKRFGETYKGSKVILISSWKTGFVSSGNNRNSIQIKELEEKLLTYQIRIVGKVQDAPYRDIAIKNFLKEHSSIKEYVILDDDISEYSSRNISNLKLVNKKRGYYYE